MFIEGMHMTKNTASGAFTIYLFTALIVAISYRARGLATGIHFHFSLIFAGKAWRIPLEQSPVKGYALVASDLACKY